RGRAEAARRARAHEALPPHVGPDRRLCAVAHGDDAPQQHADAAVASRLQAARVLRAQLALSRHRPVEAEAVERGIEPDRCRAPIRSRCPASISRTEELMDHTPLRGVIALAALVCSTALAAADPNKVLRVAFPTDVTGFDPQAVSDLYSNHINRVIFEPPLA